MHSSLLIIVQNFLHNVGIYVGQCMNSHKHQILMTLLCGRPTRSPHYSQHVHLSC